MGEPFEPFTLTRIVGDISDWELYDCSDSKELLQYNVPWKLEFKRTDQDFSVFLKCGRDAENEEWSIKVKFELTLSSTTGKTYVRDFEANFTRGSAVYGIDDFITWSRLNEEFVFNDQVILDAKVTIIEMIGVEKKKKLINFDDEESKKLSDVTLCIGDEKFHVLKQHLARQSPYFHSMFFRDFKDSKMEEIHLKDVCPENFQCFLEVINLEPTLSDDCVENVLQLADMYGARNVTRQCEEFLIHKSNHSNRKLLQMVDRYHLNNLMEDVLESMRFAAEVRAAMDPNMKNPEILRRLLDMALKFQK